MPFKDTGYVDEKLFESLESDCTEILRILIASIKTAKKKNSE